MAKKSKGKSAPAKSGMAADDHRKIANTLQARARIHHAKADLIEAKNPAKKPGGFGSNCL